MIKIIKLGSGFSSNQCENQVLIGGVVCPLTSSSSTSLTCQLSTSNSQLQSNVQYPVEVLVKNFGYALQSSTFLITFVPVITSFTPTTGSIVGGTQITINGLGFSSSGYVQFGTIPNYFFYNNDGNNTNITFSSIVINTASLSNFGISKDSNYEIKVYSNGQKAVCSVANSCNFTFSSSITPNIISISPTTASGSTLMTISGTNFVNDMSLVKVVIGNQQCPAASATTTQITCQLNGLNLGSQNVLLNINGLF